MYLIVCLSPKACISRVHALERKVVTSYNSSVGICSTIVYTRKSRNGCKIYGLDSENMKINRLSVLNAKLAWCASLKASGQRAPKPASPQARR